MTEITEDRIATWREGLEALVAQIGPLFRRSEVRARVGPVLRGLLGSAERKNGWQLAEAIGEDDPHGVQRLLAEAVWDADAARDVLRRYVTTHLGTPEGALVVDETGFLKKGERSVGVARQDSGTAGKVENCQVPVFLTYAGERGHAFLDRALYLPRAWTDDPLRLRAAGVPHAWVLGDSVYGDDGDLRADLEARGEAYALGVSASHVIWEGGEGREARALIAALPPAAWARLSAGRGSQGERLFDWCWLRLTPSDDRGMARWLVARRTLGEKPEVAYFRVYGPAASSLATLALAIGAPWTIEDCIAEAKGLTGLDEYEVRGWVPWHRHVTLALLAHAFLAVTRTSCPATTGQRGGRRRAGGAECGRDPPAGGHAGRAGGGARAALVLVGVAAPASGPRGGVPSGAARAPRRPGGPGEPPAERRRELPAPTEAQWEAILALVREGDKTAHRKPLPQRPILEGILWMMENSARWQDIPDHFGAWKTVESRYYRWVKRGIWAAILAILLPSPAPDPAPP